MGQSYELESYCSNGYLKRLGIAYMPKAEHGLNTE